jgi:HK97 family phage prohead protease
MMERRYSKTTVRNDGGKIRGTASVTYDGSAGSEYELWDGVVERIAPGAFDRHLAEAPDVVALFNHDANLVLGRTPDTLRLRADKHGLHYEIDPPDTILAKDLLKSIERGDIRGSSFAFIPTDVEWLTDGAKDVRLVREARLYDVSPVTTPAYSGTSVGVRSAEDRSRLEDERANYKARLESERRFNRLDEILNIKNT